MFCSMTWQIYEADIFIRRTVSIGTEHFASQTLTAVSLRRKLRKTVPFSGMNLNFPFKLTLSLSKADRGEKSKVLIFLSSFILFSS